MKKNNLFKISLLLLMSNLSSDLNADWTTDYAKTFTSDEVKACRAGVKARGRSSAVQLLTSFEDIKNVAGKTPNPTLKNNAEKAAWIFGYNQNMTGYIGTDGLSYMWDNDNDTGVMFNLPAPVAFGAIDGFGLNTRAWLGPLEVCAYGSKIGWAFDAGKSGQGTVLNFYKTSGAYSRNDMLGVVFGERFSEKTRGAYGRRNMLQNILNSFNRQPNSACACTGFTDSSPFTRNANGDLQ
jgi:hypothetical protein